MAPARIDPGEEEAMLAEIVGRDQELDLLRRFVVSIADGPAALLLEGAPGVGKTTLWRAGVAMAGRPRSRSHEPARPRPRRSSRSARWATC
jgi:ABC-type transport system involved in cytochrome c biogenesis ATPase subunit